MEKSNAVPKKEKLLLKRKLKFEVISLRKKNNSIKFIRALNEKIEMI